MINDNNMKGIANTTGIVKQVRMSKPIRHRASFFLFLTKDSDFKCILFIVCM